MESDRFGFELRAGCHGKQVSDASGCERRERNATKSNAAADKETTSHPFETGTGCSRLQPSTRISKEA